jgi:hypothetical protein
MVVVYRFSQEREFASKSCGTDEGTWALAQGTTISGSANFVIGGTIAGILHDDALTRTKSGSHVQRIFVELAENDRSTGYGMLHGTLNFDYAFIATMTNDKQIKYECIFMWNDRIDPSARQGDTPWVMAAKLYYSPVDYDITIKWAHTYIIDK